MDGHTCKSTKETFRLLTDWLYVFCLILVNKYYNMSANEVNRNFNNLICKLTQSPCFFLARTYIYKIASGITDLGPRVRLNIGKWDLDKNGVRWLWDFRMSL